MIDALTTNPMLLMEQAKQTLAWFNYRMDNFYHVILRTSLWLLPVVDAFDALEQVSLHRYNVICVAFAIDDAASFKNAKQVYIYTHTCITSSSCCINCSKCCIASP